MAKVFYVIGASGVGKDSLLNFARARLPIDAPVAFAHRYITRPANAGGENHIALSKPEFISRKNLGCFAMHWHSHATHYGIGIEIDQWLQSGLHVVVNGSRAYLERAAEKYASILVPILISADQSLLRERLIARGRETVERIEQRLSQAAQLDAQTQHPNLQRLNNNGELADAGNLLTTMLLENYSN